MLRKISFRNFYSFKDSFEMSFLTRRKTTFDYVKSQVDDSQISKIATIFGGNGSGKTNVVRVFGFLQHFVSRNLSDSDDDRLKKTSLAYKTFFSNKEESEIKVELEENEKIFYYTLVVKDNIVVKELLEIKTTESIRHKVFEKSETLYLSKRYFESISSDSLPSIKEDSSVIAFFRALPFEVGIMKEVDNVFSKLFWHVNINEVGQPLKNIHFASLMYKENKDLFEEVQDFISNFDIGLQSFDISENDDGSYNVKGVHGDKTLDFYYESRGTQALYALLAPIFIAMRLHGVVVIDELETGMHPEAVNKLLSYFLSESVDARCQFIFSTHAIDVMEKVGRDQIFLVEKNNEGESQVYRLSDVEGSRSDENFIKKYKSGKYGAFPQIRV